jgi:hypothetical protein
MLVHEYAPATADQVHESALIVTGSFPAFYDAYRAWIKRGFAVTPRGAVIWRAGDGPKSTPEHLTPQDAQERLEATLRRSESQEQAAGDGAVPLWQAAEAWLAERQAERGLKRSTVADYEDLFERLYRDLGAETPVHDLADGRLRPYFAEFKAERLLGAQAAAPALAEGLDVAEVKVERWTAQPPGSQVFEVPTMREAVRAAARIGGTWKHRRRGCYRVTAAGAERAKRVSRATARRRQAEGWIVCQRAQVRWMLRSPASAQTRNKYRDISPRSLTMRSARAGLKATRLPPSSARATGTPISESSDEMTSTIRARSTGYFATRRARSRRHSGCVAPMQVFGYRVRRWGVIIRVSEVRVPPLAGSG